MHSGVVRERTPDVSLMVSQPCHCSVEVWWAEQVQVELRESSYVSLCF